MREARCELDIGQRLLEYLRSTLGDATLAYAEPPARIVGGYDTTIYSLRLAAAPDEFGRPLILRVFRDDTEPVRPRFERAVQNAVASLGFPAPRVLLAGERSDAFGAAFLLMARVPGERMLERMWRGFHRTARLLGKTHARLHGLDVHAFRRSLGDQESALVETGPAPLLDLLERRAAAASLQGLRSGITWLRAHKPPEAPRLALCHGDFHPLNILLVGEEVSGVIDWTLSRVADPAFDVGATIAIFRHGPIDLPAALQPLADVARRLLLTAYLHAYLRESSLDRRVLRYYEALRCLLLLLEAGEKAKADMGMIPPISKPTAFASPRTKRRITARLRRIMDLDVVPV
jgi:aminoglycoside phosphotransferase (APT) family kinase protein